MIHLKSNTLGQAVKRNFQRASLLGLLLAISSLSAFSQAAGPVWSGTVQCQLNDQDQSYTRQDIQTWTLPGTGPISPTGIPVYNAIWKASGHGQLQRVQGGQTTNIQWTTNVPDTPATITIFVRAADNKLIVKPYHSQLSVFNATNGTRQVIVNGVAQPPTNFSHPASEWQFPRIEVTPPAANGTTTGTSPSLTDVGGVELAHHLGGLPPSASCQWQLTQGTGTPQNSNQGGMGVGSSNQNPPQSGSATTQNGNADCSKSTADIEQSFDAMKADIKTQYDKLIQSTTDPMEIARLTNQEQSTLRNLENQKQHDIQSTNNSCGRTSSGSTTSSSATGSTNGSTTGTTTGTPANGSTTGSLGTTPTTVTPDGYEPNDSQAMARLLGTLHAGQSISISANLHTAADRDFFQFNLGTGATATVVLSGIQTGSDFDLYAYRADHSLLTSSTTRGTGSETITIQSDPAQALTSFILEVRSVTWSAASPSYSLLISAAASTTAGDGSGTTGTGTSQTSPLNPVAVPLPQTPAKLTLPPAVISITPNTMICGQELVVKVVGQNTNWASNHTHIGFSSDISASYTDVQDATHATAKIDCHGQELISSGGTATVYMNTDGQRVGSQSPIFTLLGQPIVTAINPSTGHQGDQNLTVTLTTKNANAVQGSTTAYFGDGITVNSLQIAPNSATAVITIAPTAPLGTYYPALKTNGVSTFQGTFTVQPALGSVISITPNTLICGQEIVVKVVGQNTNWVAGHSHIGFSSDITAETEVQDATHASATVSCHGQDLIFSGGTATVKVFTDGQLVFSQSPIFTILGQPLITAVNPSTGHQEDQNLTVTLTTKNANAVQGLHHRLLWRWNHSKFFTDSSQ